MWPDCQTVLLHAGVVGVTSQNAQAFANAKHTRAESATDTVVPAKYAFAFDTFFGNQVNGTFAVLGVASSLDRQAFQDIADKTGWHGLLVDIGHDSAESQGNNADVRVPMKICADNVSPRNRFESNHFHLGFWSDRLRLHWHGATSMSDLPQESCMSLNSVMQKAGLNTIDLLEVQAQYAEPELFTALNLTAFQVHVVLVEAEGLNMLKQVALQHILGRSELQALQTRYQCSLKLQGCANQSLPAKLSR